MRLSQDKKNSADLGGCYPPPPSASVDNTLLDLQNSSYPTQPHSIIANYFFYACERAESCKSWDLIGSESGQFFTILRYY